MDHSSCSALTVPNSGIIETQLNAEIVFEDEIGFSFTESVSST